MCGGSSSGSMMGGKETESVLMGDRVAPVEYNAPALQDVYKQYQESGKVPYSYYGQGSPQYSNELRSVMQAYPDAFPQGQQMPVNNEISSIDKLASMFLSAFAGRKVTPEEIQAAGGANYNKAKETLNKW